MINSSSIKIIVLVGLLFVIVYPLKFVFFPYASTRVLLGILGIPFLLREVNLRRLSTPKNILLVFLLIMLWSILVLFFNGTSDFFFVTYPISVIIILSACCFWIHLAKIIDNDLNPYKVSKYLLLTVDIQMIIVVLFFISPAFKVTMLSLLTEELHPLSEQGGELYFRVSGFGSGYYASGIVHCFVLQVCMFCICKENRSRLFCILSFFLISIVGTIMARTTLIGIFVSLLYYLFFSSKSFIYVLRKVATTLGIVCMVVLLWNSLHVSVSEEVDQQIRFGFEMFYNYFESGDLETVSTNDLKDSYSIYPSSLKTWLLGDGLFYNERGENYMVTDNGYMRMVFYFGIIGMFLLFAYNYFLYKNTAKALRDKSLPLLFLILYFIINMKGDVLQVAVFYGLFLFIPGSNQITHYMRIGQTNCSRVVNNK